MKNLFVPICVLYWLPTDVKVIVTVEELTLESVTSHIEFHVCRPFGISSVWLPLQPWHYSVALHCYDVAYEAVLYKY